jgi:hypothetical protein
MKCRKCRTARKYKSGARCKCGYLFVLDPQVCGMSDAEFAAHIDRVSAGGTRYYTQNQLFTAYLQATKRSRQARIILGSVLAVLLGGIAGTAAYVVLGQQGMDTRMAALAALAGICVATLIARGLSDGKIDDVRNALNRWKNAGDKELLSHLLQKTQLAKVPPKVDGRDFFDYRVERVLIVDDKLLVDQLLLNNWHEDNSTLVLSACGYPQYLWVQLPQFLKDVPQATIFLLHGAGEAVEKRLRESVPDYAADSPVIDLGISKDDAVRWRHWHLRPHGECAGLSVDVLPVETLGAWLSHAVETGRPLATLEEQ